MTPAAILDVDGTLVDTNYQHALAWYRAFRRLGEVLPIWRIHRHIGMGGDHLVTALCGERVEEEKGDAIRDAETELYFELIEEVEPLHGARELISDLKQRGHAVLLARSAKADEVEHYVDLLDARELADGSTTSADVDATKPEPDLVEVARREAGGGAAVLVGDSTWDCEAGKRAGVETIAVLTGGFSEQELLDAGQCASTRRLTSCAARWTRGRWGGLGEGHGFRTAPWPFLGPIDPKVTTVAMGAAGGD